MEEQNLYVVFASTPYKMGRMIRCVTGAEYNHVSISLDPNLKTMYGFARRYKRTPFYGGFVIEKPCRYKVNGKNAHIKVCKLPVSKAGFQSIKSLISSMEQQKEQYLYNHLSVFGMPLKKRVPVKNAYICVEFCIQVLQLAGMDVDPEKYYSLQQTEALLEPYVIYTGPMLQDDSTDPVFYAKKPVPHPILTSVKSMFALLPRIGHN